MRAIHKIAYVGATAAALVGIGLGTGGIANADPATSPTLTTLVGVGSDTITPLFAGSPTENTTGSLIADYNATSPTFHAATWDAISPAGVAGGTITAKASGSSDTSCNLTRPNGSGAGITALNANQQDATQANGQAVYCIDYARSSRAPNSTTFKDAFSPQATDAIAWGYPVLSGVTSPQPASLTRAQLVAIYTCVDTNWSSVGGTSAPIVPVVPQSGSGTRSTFLAALGITASSEPCWINGVAANGAPIEENSGLSSGNTDTFTQTGNVFDNNTASSADIIWPYSIGDWIAQGSAVTGTGLPGTTGAATVGGHASSIWGHGNLKLAETVNPINGTAEPAVSTNGSGQPVINPNFSPQFARTLYVVVRNGTANPTSASTVSWPTTPSYDSTGLQALFGPSGWDCTNVTAQSDWISYGFGLLSSNCGALTAGD